MKVRQKDVLFSDDQYFEGTLQLRNPTTEIINFVENSIRKQKNVKISSIVKVTNGFDYYLSSQKYLRSLGKKLSESFPGDLKYSRKIFTRNRQTSKEVYRVSVLFRYYDLKKGDIVRYKGEEMEIMACAKKLKLKRLSDSKLFQLSYDDKYLR